LFRGPCRRGSTRAEDEANLSTERERFLFLPTKAYGEETQAILLGMGRQKVTESMFFAWQGYHAPYPAWAK
jgi:hypothetical protein